MQLSWYHHYSLLVTPQKLEEGDSESYCLEQRVGFPHIQDGDILLDD